MVSVCFYFQVHQPYRVRHYPVFDIGHRSDYFSETKSLKTNNEAIMHKVAKKSYLPTNALILELLQKHPEFKVSYSISGVALEQMEQYYPKVLDSFQKLGDTGQVEFLSETYYHSLAFLYSKKEFVDQVKQHKRKIKEHFSQSPSVFRNTELIYNNEIGNFAESMGYKAILAEGWDYYLGWRSPNFLYRPKGGKDIKMLLKNYKLSDDISFRFGNKGWEEWPLDTGKFSQWVNAVNGNGDCVNLFMDYETFGEHQWEDTGIFNFIRHLPEELLKHPDNNFMTPSELADAYPARDELDIPHLMSWADMERDVSAWLGNKLQQESLKRIYEIEPLVRSSNNPEILDSWKKLQTSDHFYYMCTKWFNDGDVHKYFSPYESPYEAFINYTNALNDLMLKLRQSKEVQLQKR